MAHAGVALGCLPLLPLALLGLLVQPLAVSAESNTNTCLALLGSLNANCPASSLIPSKGCCIAISDFNKAGCFCNPAIRNLVGGSNMDKIHNLAMPVCIVEGINPLWWPSSIAHKVNWVNVQCEPFQTHTYNGGQCALNDMEIDAARLSNLLGFSGTILNFIAQPDTQCFNLTDFEAQLSAFVDPSPIVTVGYGVGSYSDLASAAEYLAMVVSKVNKNMWRFGPTNPATAATDPNAALYVFPNGSRVVVGATHGATDLWFNSCTNGTAGYQEQYADYEGCNTVVKHFTVPGTSVLNGRPTSLNLLAEKLFYVPFNTSTWGIDNICHYHQHFCTGSNQQFDSFNECVRFLKALPEYSPVCGPGLILSGNSTACRFKHAYMVPLEPAAHCFHIGYGHRADVQGHFKCNDDLECSPNNPAFSDPNQLSFAIPKADQACMAQDVASYTSWQPPTGICGLA